MFEFTVVHKHCGYTKTVQGYNVWDAMRSNNLDHNVWIVESVSRM